MNKVTITLYWFFLIAPCFLYSAQEFKLYDPATNTEFGPFDFENHEVVRIYGKDLFIRTQEGTVQQLSRLKNIVIPVVDLQGASLLKAIEVISEAVKAGDPKGVGLPISLNMDHYAVDAEGNFIIPEHNFTMILRKINVLSLITAFCDVANLDYDITDTGILLKPRL